MYLNASTDSLEINLGGSVATYQLQWNVSWQDITASGMTLPQSGGAGLTNNSTGVTMVAAPAASTTRQVTNINVYNADTATATVTIRKDVSGTKYVLIRYALTSLDTLMWSREDGWRVVSGGSSAITALTGDVTATGPGSAAATIANQAVTYAKMQNVSAASVLLGRGSAAGAGSPEEITIGSGLTMTGTVLSASATAYTFSTGLTNSSGTITNNLSTGVAGGQSVIGGTAASNNLTLSSTSNATKGKILFGTSAYDEVNNRLGIGTTSPGYQFTVVSDIITADRGLFLSQFNNGIQAAAATFQKSRGTIASPSNVSTNDLIGAFTFSARVAGTYTSDRALFGAKMESTSSIGLFFNAGTTDGSYNPGIYIHPSNNVLIGSSQSILVGITDSGYRLDVNGTARVQTSIESPIHRGNTTASGTLTLESTSNATKGKILFGTSAYDEVNNRLGIGTDIPVSQIHLVSTDTAFNSSNAPDNIFIDKYAVSRATNLVFRKARGTFSYPSAVTTGDNLGVISWFGYNGTAFSTSGASIVARPTQTFTTTATGTNLEFGTTPNGSTTGVVRITIFESGNVFIGASPSDGGYRLDVNGTARVQGDFTISTKNIITDGTTGTKIGTATSQKLGFWNATPIVQPTTGVAAATVVAVGGTNIQTNDTFDGYTLAQVVKALRNTGILA